MPVLARRGFLFGAAASLVAAPAIVKACSLMPVRGIVMDVPPVWVHNKTYSVLYMNERMYWIAGDGRLFSTEGRLAEVRA